MWCDVQVFIRSKQVVGCIMREWLEDKTKDRLQMGLFFFSSHVHVLLIGNVEK